MSSSCSDELWAAMLRSSEAERVAHAEGGSPFSEMGVSEQLCAGLSKLVGVRSCFLTDSGTTALFRSLLALDLPEPSEVVVPAHCCPAVPGAVVAAGHYPVCADVSMDTFVITADTLRKVLTPRTRAVVAVHLFGIPCDLSGLRQLCREHGVWLIEDCAQALGGRQLGRPLGSMGDLTIVSFGPRKVVDARGGGAILTGSDELYERLLRPGWSSRGASSALFGAPGGKRRRWGFYLLDELLWNGARPRWLRELARAIDSGRIGADSGWPDRLLRLLKSFEKALEARRRNSRIYHEHLTAYRLQKPRLIDPGDAIYRYPILLPAERRLSLFLSLRRKGVRIHRLYPRSLTVYCDTRRRAPNSDEIARRIVNLPVDEKVQAEMVCEMFTESVRSTYRST